MSLELDVYDDQSEKDDLAIYDNPDELCKFIMRYEAHPCLWNAALKSYSDRLQTLNAKRALAREFDLSGNLITYLKLLSSAV